MRILTMVAACALAAGSAFAQTLPVFDESLGFEVLGVVDGDGVLVNNAGETFYCDVDEGPDDAFLVLVDCIALVGPKAGSAASADILGRAAGEEALLDGLDGLPVAVFLPAVQRTLRDFGCVVQIEADEDAFLAALAKNVAADAGYTAPLSKRAVEEIADIAEDAGDVMVENGMITLDREAGVVRLANCP